MPKTAAGRVRQLEKVARQRERLQRELTEARRKEAAITAAVKADEEKVRTGLERAAGRMILDVIEEKRALAADGDARAQRNLDYWMEKLDSAVNNPACRELVGLAPGKAQDEPSHR